jgi:hypothetical protein
VNSGTNRGLLFGVLLIGIALSGACSDVEPRAKEVSPETHVEIRDGWYYINGQKFFVNALGYEIGARPGQNPYKKRSSEPERVKSDIAVIKEAGFNAIRTWSELSEEELRVVQDSELKVILGIGIEPEDNFSDPEVVEHFMGIVKNVLAYSKNYDAVITYIIMNEPMPQHIKNVGAQATVDLWKKMRDLIHREHPGIPVTISGNSAITEFVDMNVFDVYGYNAYDYDGFNYTHGFANAARILPQMNGQGKPLLLTEFGMSVSRQGGEARYGGNTLMAQMDILPWYYRQLLDAGAAGACPFYYADGWWKGEEPGTHDDTPEEWFGFWGYRDAGDTVGYPRPVWHAMKEYNMALISSPGNQTFYKNEVPLEIFLQDDVHSMRVVYQDRIIFSRDDISEYYLEDTISFAGEGLRDRELVFEFYDENGKLIKLEGIVVLTGDKDVEWPTVNIKTPLNDLEEDGEANIEITLKNDSPFTLAEEVRYLFSTHIGWSRGERRRWSIDRSLSSQTLTDSYVVPEESPVLGLYAGTEISYGKFVKTIHDEHLIYRGTWADPIRIK